MGYPTKLQCIERGNARQWFVNFPSAVAQAMDFRKGETLEWVIEEEGSIVLRRRREPRREKKGGPARAL